jgi:hypothetical protein
MNLLMKHIYLCQSSGLAATTAGYAKPFEDTARVDMNNHQLKQVNRILHEFQNMGHNDSITNIH